MKPGTNDPDIRDTGVENIEALYRALPDEEPPALVDQAVLNRARRAVEGQSERPWNFGWIHALSTAAIVVLGVAIVLHEPAPPREPLRVALPPSGKLRDIESEIEALQIPAERDSARRQEARPATIHKLEAYPEITRELLIHAPPPAGAAQASAENLAASDAMAETEAPAPQAPAGIAAMVDEATALAEERMKEIQTDPQAWIARLLALKADGKMEELAREIEAFRAAYPDHPLPAELDGE